MITYVQFAGIYGALSTDVSRGLAVSAHLRHHRIMQLERALADMGGAARYADLRAAGVLAATLRSVPPPVRRVTHGVFALPQTPSEVLAARILQGQIGCLSACHHWQLPLLDRPIKPYIMVGRNRGGSLTSQGKLGVIVHRSDRHSLVGLYANPFDAIDQAARCTSPIGQVAMLDYAISHKLIAPEDARTLTVGPRRRREWVARNVDPSAESILESVSRCAMRIAGYKVEPQVWFGQLTRVDFLVEEKLVIETDGAQHSEPRAVAHDRVRDRNLARKNLRVMRYGYWDILPSSASFVRDLWGATGKVPHRQWMQRLEWALAVPSR